MSATEPHESTDLASAPTEAPPSSLLSGTTGLAPPCPMPLTVNAPVDGSLPSLAQGSTIADFEILRLLGSGGFARVYLARQISLGRLVALKVSANFGSEARSLARLEHHHIVQIFAEIVEPAKNLRLLCMQFIPGITLARVITGLGKVPSPSWSGRAYITLLDELCTETTTFDLSGLGVRAFLERCDHAELTCWLGARLAEALAHAHSQGVIHRDIKPANILINRYGRPYLADFNISVNTQSGEGAFGGTLAYMAPEHLQALKIGSSEAQESVDERSDLYSLALVLFEFVTGKLPLTSAKKLIRPAEALEDLLQIRQAGPPSPEAEPALAELPDRLLRRCLAPAPTKRFPSAETLMNALDGCREILRVEKETQTQDVVMRWCRMRPFFMVILLGIVPNLVGSIVNISYNALLILDMNPAQRACFGWLILVYNAVTYPLVILTCAVILKRAYRGWQRLRTEDWLSREESAQIRRHILALPGWAMTFSCVGWFPGGVIFPLALNFWSGPLGVADSLHFLLSFVISGLIAATYAYLGVQFVVLAALYPRMWTDPTAARHQACQELGRVPDRLRRFQMLAVLIPLSGATLLIGAGPDRLSLTFRVLVTSLIVLGLAGFALATQICQRLSRILGLLTDVARDDSPHISVTL